MDAERWRLVEELLLQALDRPTAERGSFLDDECRGDAALRAEVESLLAAHDKGITPRLATEVGLIRSVLHAFESEYFLGRAIGRYGIESYLGRGGMGMVFLATDPASGDHVAIKILSPDLVADPERRRAFTREYESVAALRSPHIVSIRGMEQVEGMDCLVMEHIVGRTLARMVQDRPIEPELAIAYADQILDALDAAHQAEIIHCDLKPSNVMVDERGQVKVLDFGLARRLRGRDNDAAAEPIRFGSSPYISPEQAAGKAPDVRSDIYSFGATLYEMVTGKRTFATPEALPRALRPVVTRCLANDPDRRFQCAADVRTALRRARRVDAWMPSGRALRWAGAGVVVLLVVGGLAQRSLTKTASTASPRLTQVTLEPGFSTTPAVSPDSKLLAYAHDSDSGSGLDVWLRPVDGGAPRRLVASEADDTEPSFSPDGRTLVFRSERGEGGIYRIGLGDGEGAEVFLAPGGQRPRYSPDGKWIAYWVRGVVDVFRQQPDATFVVPAEGGTPRRVAQGFAQARLPIWIGDKLLFVGRQSLREDFAWWTASVAGVPSKVRFRDENGASDFKFVGMLPERFSPTNRQVTFTSFRGPSASLWQSELQPGEPALLGPPSQLTLNVDGANWAAVSAQGWFAFHVGARDHGIWALAADTDEGRVTGEIRPLTHNLRHPLFDPAVTRDGRTLAFLRWSGEPVRHVVLDLDTNIERVTVGDLGQKAKGLQTAAGSGFVHFDDRREGSDVFLVAEGSDVSKKMFSRIGVPWYIAEDGGTLLAASTSDRRTVLAWSPGQQGRVILEHPSWDLKDARLSPDRRWVAFTADDAGTARLFVATFRGRELVPVGQWVQAASVRGTYSAWSGNGRWLYFLSDHDRFTCLWAQRMDGGRPVGGSVALHHFHHFRFGFDGGPSRGRGISVARDKIVFSLTRMSGSIWMNR